MRTARTHSAPALAALAASVALSASGPLAAPPAQAAEARTLVACAPGYPGSAAQAQPRMDAFAAALSRAAGVEVAATYEAELEPGLARIESPDAGWALVPAPFYLAYRERLDLRPVAAVEYETGAADRWALVAGAGRVAGPASLAGWTVAGTPAYAPDFVRRVALAGWGPLPGDVRFAPSRRILGDLRKAAQGEDVAVLLDRAQTDALDQLPFAGDLEVVARSADLPGFVLCRVGARVAEADAEKVEAALAALHESGDGAEALAGIRIRRFPPLPADAWRALERAHDGAAGAARSGG